MEDFVNVELELDDLTILKLALQAHKQNITLNEHINKILRENIEKVGGENGEVPYVW